MTRKAPSLTTKLAATLLARGEIRYGDAKLMTAHQICSLYQFHHNIYCAEDGSNEFWNYTPLLIAEHKARTAAVDIPTIAKNKRIARKQAKHLAAMEKTPYVTRKSRKIPSRPFSKAKTRRVKWKAKSRKS